MVLPCPDRDDRNASIDAPPACGREYIRWWAVIDIAKLGVGREDYYLREVAKDREAYLTGHGEAPGRWYGAAAGEAFGLSGQISAEGFRRVFTGCDPRTGQLLGRRHRKDGVLAYDLVFRPTKSVSVLYGIGTPDEAAAVLEAHHAGVQAALGFLESQVGLRRGRNGVNRVGTKCGLVAVGFDHRSSRAGDPLPHTHLIVINRAQGPEGRWTALDGHDLLDVDTLKAANAYYRNTYQAELSRSLGVEWTDPDRLGNCEIVGIPETVIRLFSKARCAIEEELEARRAQGLPVSSKVTNWVAHKVRDVKVCEELSGQRERWVAEMVASGWHVRTLVDAVRRQGRTERERLNEYERCRLFDRMAGPDGLTAQTSTFTMPAVLAAVGDATRLAPDQFAPLAEQFVTERAVRVLTDGKSGRLRWSTPELLELERGLVEAAASRQNEDRHVVARETVRAVLDHFAGIGKPLGEDQAAVLNGVCMDGAGVSLVVGPAGTGKTFTMDAVRTTFELANLTRAEQFRFVVRGLAPTGIAALELDAGTGIPTVTVDRFLLDLANGRDRLEPNDIVIVDEASMLGTRKAAPLLDHARQVGAKLIVVGDDRQLQSIDVGGWFCGLRQRLGATQLTINRRQLDELDRQAVALIRQGLGEEAMALYRDGGRVTVTKTAAEAHKAMIVDWWQAFSQGESAVMLAHRRVEVDRLNELAHQVMAAAGRLGPDTLVNDGREFRVGDRVVCGVNRLAIGIGNGTQAWIAALDTEAHTMTLRLDGDERREVTLPSSYLRRQLTDGRRAVDHAYALTGHKCEGITVDRVFVRGGSHADQQWAYTVMTRVRRRADLYLVETPDRALRDGAEELDLAPPMSQRPYDVAIAALGRSGIKRMAIDAERETQRPHPSTMTVKELRAERDRLAELLATAPRSQRRQHDRIASRLEEAERALAATVTRKEERQRWVASHGRGLAGLANRDTVKAARTDLAQLEQAEQVQRARVDKLAAHQRQLRRAEQQRAAWTELHAADLDRDYQVGVELGWRTRARSQARTVDAPGWLADLLGPAPDSTRGRRVWRQTAEQLESYRDRYRIQTDGLGERPDDLVQRRAWRDCQQQLARLAERTNDRAQQRQVDRGGRQLEVG
jgi:conjugative relaxase-like TrwC/TraI family protein